MPAGQLLEIFAELREIKERERQLLEAIESLMFPAAGDQKEFVTIPPRLNLDHVGYAAYESGGQTVGLTALSPTEYQAVNALHFAGRFGLGFTLPELAEFVTRWRPHKNDKYQDIRADEGSIKSLASRINSRLADGRIPYKIRAKTGENKEKTFFLEPISH